MALQLPLSFLLLTLAWPRSVESGYDPTKGQGACISYKRTAGWSLFPPPGTDISSPNYFISRLNFDILEGSLVTGAADSLYILSASDLSLTHQYNWTADSMKIDRCRESETNNADYSCRNHIRVYHSFPGNSSRLFVCGTQAAIDPECRVVEFTVSDDNVDTREHNTTRASDGLISYYPEFSQLGEFRRETDGDSVYFSAGFFQGNDGVGRHFSISYQNITVNSDPSSLDTTELFRTEDNNIFWLRFPVTFVGSYRADYSVVGPASAASDYQFWFVFLRENFFDSDVIYSHLVRICRNDHGSNTADRIFNTYMKARIFCERDKPSGREFTSTLDYQYNSITSFSFSTGRYYGDATHQKVLYGAFSSPRNGPLGSAICAYPAGNSVESEGDGQSESVFDIFREDLTADPEGGELVENNLVECEPDGRESNDEDLVLINPSTPVKQIGTDPLIVLEDLIITQMAVDQVCVVQRDSSKCRNQDVLFLGLDTGKVLKVVFGTEEGGGSSFPIIAEEIELDDNNPVNALEIKEVGGEKYLFVATDTRIYKLPLHRCDRFDECQCNNCVLSRDPYCVYNTQNSSCTANPLTASGGSETDVPDYIIQNIHDTDPPSCDCTNTSFNSTILFVDEGVGSVGVAISSSEMRGSVSVSTESGSATSPEDFTSISIVLNFTSSRTDILYINITDDMAFEPNQSFYVRLAQTGKDDVIIITPMATITIIDNDGSSGRDIQVGFTSSTGCGSVTVNSDLTTSTLTDAVVSGIIDNCVRSCDDFSSSHIIEQSVTWSCDKTQYFTLRGQLLATERATTDDLLTSLTEWVQKRTEVEVDGLKLTANCFATGSTLMCPAPTPTKPSGLASSSETTYTEGEFAAVMVLLFISLGAVVILAVVVVVIGWMLRSYRQERYSSRVGVSREPSQQSHSSPAKQATPQTSHAGTPKVVRLTSYQEAQKTPLAEFPGFAGPEDVNRSEVQNAAYVHMGALEEEGEGGEGRKEGTYEEIDKEGTRDGAHGEMEKEKGEGRGGGVENGDAVRTDSV